MKRQFLLLLTAFLFSLTINLSGTATWNYTISTGADAPLDTTGATYYNVAGDDVTQLIPYAFNFYAYDNYYTTSNNMELNSSGIFSFGPSAAQIAGGNHLTGSTLPFATLFGPYIAYGGTNDGYGLSRMYSKTIGTSPNRIQIIGLKYKTWYSSTTTKAITADVQIQLYEADGKIMIHYSNVVVGSPLLYWPTQVGIDAGDGVFATVFGTNGAYPLADTSITFTRNSSLTAPTAFAASPTNSYQIDFTATANGSGNDIIVFYNPSNSTFSNPVNGTTYNVGSTLGGARVIYKGPAASIPSFHFDTLQSSKPYYFRAWSYSGTIYSLSSLASSAQTPAVVAPTAFVASGSSTSSISLSWALNAMSDSVIVIYNTTSGNFPTLTNGTVYTSTQAFGAQGTAIYKGKLTNFLHSGLTNGITYYYQIWSFNKMHNYSVAATASSSPSAMPNPGSFTATAQKSFQVKLDWTAATATNYILILRDTLPITVVPSNGTIYGTSGNLGSATIIYNNSGVTTLSFTQSTLFDGKPYYYKAWAYEPSQYAYSSGLTASATTPLVAAPTITVGTPGTNNIPLTFTYNNTTDSILVLHTTTSGNYGTISDQNVYNVNSSVGGATVIYRGPATSFNHTGLLPATPHYYKAYALDDYKNYSAASAEQSASTTSITNPSSFTATAAKSFQINLAWGSVGNNVLIVRDAGTITWSPTNSVASPGVGSNIGTGIVVYNGVGTAAAFSDNTLNDGTPYNYKIWAYSGSNIYSSGLSASATTSLVAAPTVTVVSTGTNYVNLSFTKGASDSILVLRSNSSSGFGTVPTDHSTYSMYNSLGSATIVYRGPANTFTDNYNISFATTYYYKAYSLDDYENYSAISNLATATTQSVQPVTSFTATGISSWQVGINWSALTGSDSVLIVFNTTNNFGTPANNIYETGDAGPGYKGTVIYNGNGTSLTHSPLEDNKPYYYKIWKYDTDYNYSTALSDTAKTKLIQNPGSLVATASTSSSINLVFTSNAASDNIVVVYNTNGNFSAPQTTQTYTVGNPMTDGIYSANVIYNGPAGSFLHSGLALGNTYYYKAFTYDGFKNYSSGINDDEQTLSLSPPSSFTATAAGPFSIDLSWVPTGDSVLIAWNTSNSFGTPSNGTQNILSPNIGTVLYSGNATSTTLNGLTPNTAIYFKIWTKNSSNYYSTGITANATTSTIAPPTAFDATMASQSSINLTWTKNASSDTVMIARFTADNFSTPTSPYNYLVGNTMTSNGPKIIYKGVGTSTTDNDLGAGLSPSTKYYYMIWSVRNGYHSGTSLKDSALTDAPGISTFPYLETFDAQTSLTNPSYSCYTYYPLTTGWVNVTNDQMDWVARTGQATLYQTGPNYDHSTGTGVYLHLNVYTSCYNQQAWLVSPLFNFSSLTQPKLEFYYHMYGNQMGSIDVQVSTDGGNSWSTNKSIILTTPSTTVNSISGQQHTSKTDAWRLATVDLSTYAGMSNIKLRIKGTSGNGILSYAAIDDIKVFSPQNMAVTEVITEMDTLDVVLGATNQEVIRVNIKTVGAYSPLSVGAFTFNTTGTTNLSDITNAKVFYTANIPTFSSTTQFGSAWATPNGPFIITAGSFPQLLAEGNNYFWLTYDISSSATIGNNVDAECNQVTVSSTNYTPIVQAPTGAKKIIGQVTVGTGTYSSGMYGPTYYSSAYAVTESIYLQSEMGAGAKEITKIGWLKASGANMTNHIDSVNIYLKDTSISSLSSGPVNLAGYTLVYSGVMPNYLASGWIDVTLDNSFLYDGTSNLSVVVVQHPNSSIYSPYTYWTYTATTPNKTRYGYSTMSMPTNLNLPTQGYRPNARFQYVLPASMSFSSVTTTQTNTSNIAKGSLNQEIIGIQVVTNNTANPLSLTELTFNITGTTSAADISNAKVYYTGTSSVFANTSQFGSTQNLPTGPFVVSGTQTLASGVNYFWLAYSISSTATINNVVDATCTSVKVGATSYTPTVTNPNGSRTIKDYIIIGNGTQSDYTQPLHAYYYNVWNAIYTASELGSAKDLSALAFYKLSGTNTVNQITGVSIYMKHTDSSVVYGGTYNENNGYTLVYQGSFTNNAESGWMQVPFIQPFAYNGTQNVEVLIKQSYGTYFSGYPYWAYATVTPNRARYANNFSAMPTTLPTSNRLANIRFEYSNPAAMTFASSTVTQNNITPVTKGINDQEIIGIQVVANNSGNPLSVTQFTLSTAGSTSPTGDITNAKIYYTANSPSFSTANLFGTYSAPNGAFQINGNQTLTSGTNYFWLTYDIPLTATTNNLVNATCSNFVINGQVKIPTAPPTLWGRSIVGALNGEYTIGTGGDFSSFTAAVNALNSYGVSGWVKFRVFSGTYTEQISLNPYTNASATNTVTFEAYTGDSSDVILQYSSGSSTSNYTVRMNGSYFILKNLTIKALGTTYGNVIEFANAANYNRISNNEIVASTGGNNNYGIYMYNVLANYNTIRNNYFSANTYTAIAIRGTSTSASTYGNIIDSNIVKANTYGIMSYYNSNITISNNQVTVTATSGSAYGLYIYYCTNGVDVYGNKIITTGTPFTSYGVYLVYSGGTSSAYHNFYNNFVNVNTTANNYNSGIYGSSLTYWNIYHNNINISSSSGNNRYGLYVQSGSNVNLKNNMLVATAGGSAIYLPNGGISSLASNYNNLYSTGSTLVTLGTTSYASLSAWKTASNQDLNSISVNPNFTSTSNLHVTNVAINNMGTPIAAITKDIDGDDRHPSTPDIGADEFSVANDAGVTAINSPATSTCAGAQPLNVTIKNFGVSTLTSATINWSRNGVLQTPFNWSGTLTGNATQSITIATPNFASGTYTIKVWTSSPNGVTDLISYNDSSTSVVVVNNAANVDAGSNAAICAGKSYTTSATGSGYLSLQWTTSGTGVFLNSTTLAATYTPTAADIAAGSVYLKITATGSGTCGTAKDSLLLTINPAPSVSFSGLPTSVCPDGANSTLVGSPSGGIFSGNGIVGNLFKPALAGSGSHVIQYKYTASGGCSDSVTQLVTVHPTIYPTISGLLSGYCISAPASTLTGSPSGGTYSGSISTNVFNPATMGIGNYTVKYTVVDGATTCSFDTTYTTQVYTQPTAAITGLATTYCNNNTPVAVTATPSGGVLSGPGITGTMFYPASANIGTNQIKYIYVDPSGCSDTAYFTLTVNSAPTASTSALAAVCLSAPSFSLTGGSPAGGTWSGPGVTANIFNPSVAGAGSHVLTYSYTNASNCTDTETATQVVNSLPAITITGLETSYCINSSIDTLYGYGNAPLGTMPTTYCTASSSNFAFEHITSVSLNGNTQSSVGSNYSDYTSTVFTTLSAGSTYTISGTFVNDNNEYITAYFDWNANGVFDSGEGVILATNAPVGVTTFSTNFTVPTNAANSAIKMRVVLNYGAATSACGNFAFGEVEDYKINVSSQTVLAGTFSGPGMTSNKFNPATAGTGSKTITFSYTDGNGCSNTATANTTVNALPVVSYTGLDANYCSNDAVETLTGVPTGGTFTGTGISGNQFNPSGLSGNYSIVYSYTDANGCSNTSSNSTNVNQAPTAEAGANQYISSGATTTLSGSATGGGNYSYSWSPAAKLVNATIANPTTVALTANQLFTLTVTDGVTNCHDDDDVTVFISSPTLTVTTTASNSPICAGSSSTLNANASGGIGSYTYSWTSSPAGFTSTSANPTVSPTVTTTYTVYVTSGSLNATSSVVVTVNPKPTVSFNGLDAQYCSNDAIETLVGVPAGGTFTGTGITGSQFNPSGLNGNYTIVYSYTDLNNCSNTASNVTHVYQAPTANAGIDKTILSGSTTTLSGSATGGSNYSYSWSPAAKLVNSNIANPTTVALSAAQVFTLTVTDGVTTCHDDDDMTVFIISPTLTAVASVSDDTLCVGESAQLDVLPTGGIGGYTYSWSSNPAGFTSTAKTPTVSPTVSTTYTVTVTSGIQTANSTVNIVVNPLPTVNFTGLATAYCQSASPVALSGTPSGGIYSGPGITGNVFNPATAGLGAKTITYTYTNANGCVGVSSKNTTVYSNPVANAGSDNTINSNTSTTLNGSATGGSGSFGYSWSPSAMLVSSTTATVQTVNLTSSTLFTLTVTDNNTTCQSTDDVLITVQIPGSLTVAPVTNPDTICAGETSVLNAIPTGGNGVYNYSWTSSPAGFTSSIANPTVSPTVTTTYTVNVTSGSLNASGNVVVVVNPVPVVQISGLASSYCSNSTIGAVIGIPVGGVFLLDGVPITNIDPYTIAPGGHIVSYVYQNSYGCLGTANQNVTLYQAPTTNAGSDVTINANNDTILYGSASGGANYSYSWTPASLVTNPTLATTSTVNLISTQTFNLTVTDTITGCSDNDDVTVYVNTPTFQANATASLTTICAGDSTKLDVTASGGNPPYTYTWSSLPAGFNSTLKSPWVKPTITTLYQVVVSDGTNSVNTNITIVVNPIPSVALVGLDATHCQNDIPDTLLGFPAGGTFSGIGLTSNLFNPNLANIGNNTITYTYTNSYGCVNSISSNTVVSANPIANAGNPATIWTGNDTILYGSATGGSGTYTYYWTPASLLLNPYAQNATTTILNMTTQFNLTVTDNTSGCVGTDDVIITVAGPNFQANPVAVDDTICIGGSTTLQAMVSGGSGTYIYQWTSTPGGFTSTMANPVVSPTVTTIYYVLANDGTNTTGGTVKVVVENLPTVVVSASDTVLCQNGVNSILSGAPYGGIYFGNGVSVNQFDPVVAGVGYHDVIYSYSTANGCNNKDTVTLQVIAPPTVNAGSDISIPCGGPGGLIGSNPTYGMTYSWWPTTGLTNATMSNTIATPNMATNYTLTVTDTATGCTNEDQVYVGILGGPQPIVSNDTIVCRGELVNISVNSSPNFTYLWNNGVTTAGFTVAPNTSTTYTVTVTENGCSDIDSVVVTVNSLYLFLGPDMTLVDNTPFTLDAGYGFSSYIWNTGDVTQSIVVTPYVNAILGYNSYYVTAIDYYGCEVSDTLNITYVLGLDDLNETVNLDVYPNPTRGEFSMDITGLFGQDVKLEITDLQGKVIYVEGFKVNNAIYTRNYDFRRLEKGIYIIRLMNDSLNKTYKLIIQ